MKFPRANRRIGAGRHPLTKVFPGLDTDPAFVKLFPDGARQEVLEKCAIEAVGEDMYMYHDASDGHMVAVRAYLKTGEACGLLLDVILEHPRLRHGREGKPPTRARGA